MHRLKLMLALSFVVLLVPAALAAADGRQDTRGGVAFVNGAELDWVDPALDYISAGWQIEYVTCAQLVNYPDSATPTAPQPEVAKSVDVSADGLTYSFKLRGGYRFSPPSNAPVTADAFKRALERVRDPAMASPGANFFRDVVSVTSDGDRRLEIRLGHPAGDFLARLAMPFMCAVPPDAPSVAAVDAAPVGRPVLHLGLHPGLSPRAEPQSELQRAASGQPRPDPLPVQRRPADVAAIRSRAARPTTQPADCRPTRTPRSRATSRRSSSSTRSRASATSPSTRAARFSRRRQRGRRSTLRSTGPALDRHQRCVLGQPAPISTSRRPCRGSATRASIRSNGPSAADLARANALVDQAGIRGQTRSSTRARRPPALAAAQLVKDELARIGIVVDIHAFPRAEQIARDGTRGEPFDMTTGRLVERLLRPIRHAQHLPRRNDDRRRSTTTTSRTSTTPSLNAQLQAAAQLTGTERYTTYGNLDVALARDQAPLAAIGTFNNRDFFSARMGCQTFVPPYGMDLATLCIKGAHHD